MPRRDYLIRWKKITLSDSNGHVHAQKNLTNQSPFTLSEPSVLFFNPNDKNQTLKNPLRPVLKRIDVLEDLKSAISVATKGAVPTLNRTGVMVEELIPYSEFFADYAGQCGREVLDIGCAYGVATIAALERGAKVLAVDIEQQHLDILEDRLNDEAKRWVTTQQGVLPDVDFEDGRFCGDSCQPSYSFFEA